MKAAGSSLGTDSINTPDCPGTSGVSAERAKCSVCREDAHAHVGVGVDVDVDTGVDGVGDVGVVVVADVAAFALDRWPKLGGN